LFPLSRACCDDDVHDATYLITLLQRRLDTMGMIWAVGENPLYMTAGKRLGALIFF
jgi:hypothetical protein